MEAPILVERRYFEASDNVTYDLAWLPKYLEKKIEHLPEKERRKIRAFKSIYYFALNTANVYKREAFKKDAAKSISSESILDGKKTELIDLFGRMFSGEEVLAIVNNDWHFHTSIETLNKFRKNNIEAIAIKIEEYKRSHSDVRLGIKRSRLDELTYLYSDRKKRYLETRRADDYKLLLITLEQIRKEVEGDKLIIEGSVEVNIEATIQNHLRTEIFKTLPLKEIILGRIASRMNIAPSKLVKSLNDSYYSKFSKFLDSQASDIDFEMSFPSDESYDFDSISKYHEDLKIQREEEKLVKSQHLIEDASDNRQELLNNVRNRAMKVTKETLEVNINDDIRKEQGKGKNKRIKIIKK